MTNRSAAPAETTPLLGPSNEGASATAVPSSASEAVGAQAKQPTPTAKRILISVFVANLLIALGHYIAISSIMDLIRGLSCQEYYLSHPTQTDPSSGSALDCSRVEIQDRTSTVFSYMLSINSFVSCLSALWLAPWLLKNLERRMTMFIAVLAPAVELFVLASVPNRFHSSSEGGKRWIDSPTASLRFLLLESLVFGLVGCPDTLIGIVSQTIVLDASPTPLRSTWLARLSSCTFLGMLASTVILNTLSLDISSDTVSDKLPILIGAIFSAGALLWSLFTLPACLPAIQPEELAESASRSAQQSEGRPKGLLARLRGAMEPLRLLRPIKVANEAEDEAQQHSPSGPKRDWRLTKLIIAATLCDQIALTTNNQVIYVQTRFGLHAQDLSRILGLVGLMKWVYLVLIFPRLADAVRRRYHSAAEAEVSTELLSASAAADRMLAFLSLLLDVLAWVVVIISGRALNYPTYLLGLICYALASANVSSITSLASVLLPQDVGVDSLVATLSSLANIMSTIGPILNANVYRFGLIMGFPEVVFALAAMVSVTAAVLVARTSPSMLIKTPQRTVL